MGVRTLEGGGVDGGDAIGRRRGAAPDPVTIERRGPADEGPSSTAVGPPTAVGPRGSPRRIGRDRAGTTPGLPSAGPDAGDGAAATVEALYRERFTATTRLAFLLTGDASAAEELAQEAFVRLHQHAHEVDNAGGFLRTVLVNLCHDHRRRRDTVRRYPLAARPPADPPDLPRSVTATWQAVQALPERRRDAVVLRYYADLSTDEIARLLDVRPATVRSLLHRAIGSLQEVLSDDR